MVKQKLTLSIDNEILTQAKSSGINLSSFLEIRLTDYLMAKKCSRRDSNQNLPVKTDLSLHIKKMKGMDIFYDYPYVLNTNLYL
jgi:predicted DNA-binding ribbon-helix-helix protein